MEIRLGAENVRPDSTNVAVAVVAAAVVATVAGDGDKQWMNGADGNANAVRVEASDGDAAVAAAVEAAAAAVADGGDDEGCVDVAVGEEVAAGRNTADDVVGVDADERVAIILDLAWWPLDQLVARPEQIRPQSDKSTVGVVGA